MTDPAAVPVAGSTEISAVSVPSLPYPLLPLASLPVCSTEYLTRNLSDVVSAIGSLYEQQSSAEADNQPLNDAARAWLGWIEYMDQQVLAIHTELQRRTVSAAAASVSAKLFAATAAITATPTQHSPDRSTPTAASAVSGSPAPAVPRATVSDRTSAPKRVSVSAGSGASSGGLGSSIAHLFDQRTEVTISAPTHKPKRRTLPLPLPALPAASSAPVIVSSAPKRKSKPKPKPKPPAVAAVAAPQRRATTAVPRQRRRRKPASDDSDDASSANDSDSDGGGDTDSDDANADSEAVRSRKPPVPRLSGTLPPRAKSATAKPRALPASVEPPAPVTATEKRRARLAIAAAHAAANPPPAPAPVLAPSSAAAVASAQTPARSSKLLPPAVPAQSASNVASPRRTDRASAAADTTPTDATPTAALPEISVSPRPNSSGHKTVAFSVSPKRAAVALAAAVSDSTLPAVNASTAVARISSTLPDTDADGGAEPKPTPRVPLSVDIPTAAAPASTVRSPLPAVRVSPPRAARSPLAVRATGPTPAAAADLVIAIATAAAASGSSAETVPAVAAPESDSLRRSAAPIVLPFSPTAGGATKSGKPPLPPSVLSRANRASQQFANLNPPTALPSPSATTSVPASAVIPAAAAVDTPIANAVTPIRARSMFKASIALIPPPPLSAPATDTPPVRRAFSAGSDTDDASDSEAEAPATAPSTAAASVVAGGAAWSTGSAIMSLAALQAAQNERRQREREFNRMRAKQKAEARALQRAEQELALKRATNAANAANGVAARNAIWKSDEWGGDGSDDTPTTITSAASDKPNSRALPLPPPPKFDQIWRKVDQHNKERLTNPPPPPPPVPIATAAPILASDDLPRDAWAEESPAALTARLRRDSDRYEPPPQFPIPQPVKRLRERKPVPAPAPKDDDANDDPSPAAVNDAAAAKYAALYRSPEFMFSAAWDSPERSYVVPLAAQYEQLLAFQHFEGVPLAPTTPAVSGGGSVVALALALDAKETALTAPSGDAAASAAAPTPPPASTPLPLRYYRVTNEKDEVVSILRVALADDASWRECKVNDADSEVWVPARSGMANADSGRVTVATAHNPSFTAGCETVFYWNLMWTWRRARIDFSKLLVWQRVNHFPRSKYLTRKDLLKKSIERYSRLRGFKFAPDFQFTPQTFILPTEYIPFVEAFTKDALTQRRKNFWIMKPVGSSRGRGITVINDLEQLTFAEPVVLQKYIMDPLLLDGHKFDLRLYVLVTSFDPLEAFVYTEGFARLSTVEFSTDPLHIGNRLMHLTNFSVQKEATTAAAPTATATSAASASASASGSGILGGSGGAKISLSTLRELLTSAKYGSHKWSTIWDRVISVIVKTLVCAEDDVRGGVNSFELYGFDILIDSQLRAWLIEVNASPSLACETALDSRIKPTLIRDTVSIVHPLAFDRVQLADIIARRFKTGQWARRAPKTREEMNSFVTAAMQSVLRGQMPRLYGELCPLGLYERVAPSPVHDRIVRMKQAAGVELDTPQSKYKKTLPPIV